MRIRFFLLLLITLVSSVYLGSCRHEEKAKKLNLLFIITDQQPLSCVGAYGNEKIKTPNIDEIAQSGFLLENYYIAAFACSPSRASMLTGRYLHNHNVFTNNVLLDPDIPSLGTILSQASYHTGYFGKAHLGGAMYVGRESGDGVDYMHNTEPPDPVGDAIKDYWHWERVESDSGWVGRRIESGMGEDSPQLGFQEWAGGWRHYKDWLAGHGQDEFAKIAGNHDALQSAPEGQHMYSKLGERYHMAAFFTEKATAFVNKHKDGEQPWSAVLSFFGPHLPVAPPIPWDTLYSLNDVSLPDNLLDSLKEKPKSQNKYDLQYVLGQWTNEQYKDYIRRYWGYSSYIDAQIGKVIETLKQTGQWDNTIIVFTTDHGDMVAGHGMLYKLESNGYEELFHVPAILRIPGAKYPGTRIKHMASSIDLLPTILEAAQVDVPPHVDGKSLIPLLQKTSNDDREYVFAEIHGSGKYRKTIICRDGQFKYVYHWLSDDVDELYDLSMDPGEMQNLFQDAGHQDIAKQMREKIIDWATTAGHRYADLIAHKHQNSS